MAYQTLIDASSISEFEATVPTIEDLPKGTKILLRIELPIWAPFGKLADLAGAEWWAQQFMGADVRVIDVYGNWYWIEIKGIAEGTPVLLLITIIVVALSALGIAYYVSRIILDADIPTIAKAAVGLAIAGGLALIGILAATAVKRR